MDKGIEREDGGNHWPQHFLNFRPLPQGQGWFRPTNGVTTGGGRRIQNLRLFTFPARLDASIIHPTATTILTCQRDR